MPFFVRAVQIYAAANLPQAAFLAPTPETFRQFLSQQDVFLFFITVYVGAGLIANDRRANALQIYLSKPLTRTEYVFGKLAVLMAFLLLVTWVPAILLLVVQILFAGNFTFLIEQPLPVSGDHAVRLHPGADRGAGDAGAVVAVEQQPLRRHPLRGADVFYPGDLRRPVRGDRQLAAVVDVGAEQPRPDRRRDLPAARRATTRRWRFPR